MRGRPYETEPRPAGGRAVGGSNPLAPMMLVSRGGFLLVAAVVAMSFGGTAHAAVPTHHVTPSLGGAPYRFHTADGHIRCELNKGAHGTGVNCFNGRRGAMLNWSGNGAFWPFEVAESAKSRNVPAGTRLALHVPADKLVYYCRAFLSAMRCTHSVTHRGFMIGLVVARLVS
jgi:hypothetical protein